MRLGRDTRLGLTYLVLVSLVVEFGLMWFGERALPDSTPYWARSALDACCLALVLWLTAPYVLRRRDHELQLAERAMDVARDGLWVVDQAGTLLYVNEGYSLLTGYRRDELLGRNIADVERLQSPEAIRANIAYIEQRGSHTFHTQHSRQDGEPIHLCVTVVFDAHTRLFTALLRDESEAVRLERQRDALLGQLEGTFELAAVGLAHVGLDGRMLRVNRYLCDLLQYTPEELTGLSFHDFTHPADLAQDLDHVGELLAGTCRDYSMEKRYLRKDGAVVWVLLAVALARGPGGEPDHFVSVVQDLTLRRRAEADVVEAEASKRASKAKSQFLGRMSHELRTPLNAVIGFTQLLQLNDTRNLLPQQQAQLAHVRTAARHMLELIEEVLDINRVEADELVLALQHEALGDILEDARALVEGSASKVGVTLTQTLTPVALQAQVLTDRRRLMQAVLNLLTNAIKYNRPGGSVEVGVDLEPNHIAIHVRDTGPGLSDEQIAHLFEPFNRLGAERTSVSGTGLGLVITRRLVEALGGKLRVSSRPGAGSCFTIELPRALTALTPTP